MNIPRAGTICSDWLCNEDARLVMCTLQLLPSFFPIVFSVGLLSSCWKNCVLISIYNQTMLLERFIRYQAQMLSQLILTITRGVNIFFFLYRCKKFWQDKSGESREPNPQHFLELATEQWLPPAQISLILTLRAWDFHFETGPTHLFWIKVNCLGWKLCKPRNSVFELGKRCCPGYGRNWAAFGAGGRGRRETWKTSLCAS